MANLSIFSNFAEDFLNQSKHIMGDTLNPFAKPLYVMVKPASSTCNLACEYCYYLEKKNIYKNQDKTGKFIMSDALLEEFIQQYIQSQTMPQVLFTWYGGKPLTRTHTFF